MQFFDQSIDQTIPEIFKRGKHVQKAPTNHFGSGITGIHLRPAAGGGFEGTERAGTRSNGR